jgi:predicted DNA-binding transcriptional regulator AlpA
MRLLTVSDVAEKLHFSRSQVYAMKHQITYAKLGGALRFRPVDVERYIDERLRGVIEGSVRPVQVRSGSRR